MRWGSRRIALVAGLICAFALALMLHGYLGAGAAQRPHAPVAPASPHQPSGQAAVFGPATVRLAQPSDAPDVLSVQLRPGLRVRYLMDMPSMPGMGTSPFDAQPAGRGAYSGMVIFPMAGRTRIVIEVRAGSIWRPVRTLLYDVDGNRIAHPGAA